MQGLKDWCRALGWFRYAPNARDAAEGDQDPASRGRDDESVQRLLELQDELHQLDRLPGMLSGVLPDGAGDPMVRLMPVRQERALEIEAEMEHLREEMSLGAMEREAVHPWASEEIGQRILQQIHMRDRSAAPVSGRLLEGWPEADAQRSPEGADRAHGSE